MKRHYDNLIVFTREATKPNIILNPTGDQDLMEIEYGGYGWSISLHNPEDIVYRFSQLKVKNEYKLRGYQYEDGSGNGNGIVWAIPTEKELPLPNLCDSLKGEFLEPPKPAFAEDDFMVAIEGDNSPLSYLQAAILLHELHEFGAMWHGCSWNEDEILPKIDNYEDEILSQMDDYDDEIEEEVKYRVSVEDYLKYVHPWHELKEIPEILNPHFFYKDNHPTVVFYTINDIGSYTLNRYTHIFDRDSYVQKVNREVIGTGGAGKIF